MLKLSYLAQLTLPNIRKNAQGVRYRGIRAINDKDSFGSHRKILIVSEADTIMRYSVIKLYEPNQGIRSPCWVTCSCEYWLYYCEVAVWNRDSTDNLKSNGNMPVIRNPNMRPYLCKHLYGAIGPALSAPVLPSKPKKHLNEIRRDYKSFLKKMPRNVR